uniref:DUF834 domain-containing protein n=1 Tax=Oryza glumipatula TaxID=40148 RepID=A0A0E0AT62_9ORYZ
MPAVHGGDAAGRGEEVHGSSGAAGRGEEVHDGVAVTGCGAGAVGAGEERLAGVGEEVEERPAAAVVVVEEDTAVLAGGATL